MTHEEVITTHVAQVVRSYRDLPLILYHFQVKERDEPRPRAGVLRTREFIMKDSYTFDRDAEGLAVAYDRHVGPYDRIFHRCGLGGDREEPGGGVMGGLGAHEDQAPGAAVQDRGAPFRPARPEEGAAGGGPAGSMGRVGADVPILLDEGVARGGYVPGGTRPDVHLRGVEPGRDFQFERADVRRVEPGDRVNG